LEIRKRIADVQWRETVKKPTRKALEKYLATYPEGYYKRRAELLLEGLDYYAQHKAEVDEARKLIAEAQVLVDKSPVTAPWDVEIIDYQNGSVYFNLNNGPVLGKKGGPSDALSFAVHEQTDAHNNTCDLLDNRIAPIDFCLMLFSRDHVDVDEAFPVEEAIQDALTRFYLVRLDKGEAVDMTRMLELLDRMAQQKDMAFSEHRFMAQTYARLGLSNEAIYAIYTFAASKQKRADVSYLAKGVLEASPDLAQNADFQWVVERFGE
jgi:hypothetical protein